MCDQVGAALRHLSDQTYWTAAALRVFIAAAVHDRRQLHGLTGLPLQLVPSSAAGERVSVLTDNLHLFRAVSFTLNGKDYNRCFVLNQIFK